MSQKQAPWIEGAYGWSFGESGWNAGMDDNILKFSFLFDRNIDSIVSSLPPAINGQAHYNTTDNRLYFAVNTTYFSTPIPKWFKVVIRSTGATWQYNGSSLVEVESVTNLDTRLDSVELTIASLGSASFEDVTAFATPSQVDLVEANSQAYTDTLRSDLSDSSDPAKGAALIGYSGQNLYSFLQGLGESGIFLESIADLRDVSSSEHVSAFVGGYYSPNDGGGGAYFLDSADTTSADNGGSVIVASGGGRWKLVYTGRISVKQFGAKGDNVQNDQPFIQAALDAVKAVYVPRGSYKLSSPVNLKEDGYSIIGENMSNTEFTSTGTHSLIKNPDSSTTTRLFCEVKNIRLSAPSIGGNVVLDWKSCQLGTIDHVWLTGQAVVGCTLLNMAAVWTVTECTYNTVNNCYFGLMANGISITDGANNNTIRESRFQPTVANGIGVYLNGSAPGRVSSNTIRDNGFEYPGAINTGINVFQNTDGTRITGNRFEQLLNGIVVGATSNHNVYAPRAENYFEGCTVKINLTGGGNGTAMRTVAAITGVGTEGWTTAGNAYNLSCVRSAAGQYDFTFQNGTLLDAGYIVKPASITDQVLISNKTTSGFRVLTRNNAGTNVDSAILDVSVEYNK